MCIRDRLKSGDASAARQSYHEAWALQEKLGIPTILSETGIMVANRMSAPPLLGADGELPFVGGYEALGRIRRVAFSPDGNFIATGSAGDGTVTLCEANTGRVLRTFVGEAAPISQLAFSPDGKKLLA